MFDGTNYTIVFLRSFSFPNLYIPLKKYVFILILLNQIIVHIWQFCSLQRLRQQTTKQRWHDAYLEWFCPWVAWDVVCFFHWSMSRVPCPGTCPMYISMAFRRTRHWGEKQRTLHAIELTALRRKKEKRTKGTLANHKTTDAKKMFFKSS